MYIVDNENDKKKKHRMIFRKKGKKKQVKIGSKINCFCGYG